MSIACINWRKGKTLRDLDRFLGRACYGTPPPESPLETLRRFWREFWGLS